MSRLHFALFVFGLCLFALGIGIVSANADLNRVSVITTTTFVPTTTTTQGMTTTTANIIRPKPTVLHQQAKIGTALSMTRETTTTTTTEAPKTPLEVAQSQVGKTGPYAEGGFWCARLQSWIAQRAKVDGFEQSDSPARLYAVAKEQGRLTDTPQPGYLVFIDLTGQNFANEYVSHVGIVESIDGDAVNIIQGNGAPDPSVVTRTTYHLGDGYIVGFAPFAV
jgi:hypothetical protein